MFKPRLRIPKASLLRPRSAMRRSIHSVPNIGYSGAGGIPGMLSPDGFDIAWTQYMTFVVEKLNALTAGRS
jgi:superoxide dismutase, Fe-Mn family